MSNLINVSNWNEAMSAAEKISQSNLCPPNFKGKKEDIITAWAMGSELGLKPLQSLQNISVINGKPCLYGDGMLALVKNDPRCLGVQESIEGEAEETTAVCSVKRKYDGEHTETTVSKFSIKDAKRAKLFNRPVWQSYPLRMLQMRARGFALRNAFPDVLSGFISKEEAEDYPTQKGTRTINNLDDIKPKEIPNEKIKNETKKVIVEHKVEEAAQPAQEVVEKKVEEQVQPDPEVKDRWPIMNHDGDPFPAGAGNAIMFVSTFCNLMKKYANSETNKDGKPVSPRDRMTLLKEFRNQNAEQLEKLTAAQLKPVAETYKKLLAFLGAKQNG